MDQSLEEIYCNRFSGAELARSRVWQVLSDFFQQWISPSSTVLDLGAGYCEFINHVRAARKFAVDLNPATAKKAAPEVEIISHDVSQPWPLPSASIDVVFTSNFLEHLSDKLALQRCLADAYRVLSPGGKFIAMGPNIRFCYDVYWDFVDHMLPLSDRSLLEGLTSVGFEPEKTVARFLPYTMAGKNPNISLVRMYLSMPILWHFLGKQFLVIVRKPSA
jgi:SAM-dependent methyltransferase